MNGTGRCGPNTSGGSAGRGTPSLFVQAAERLLYGGHYRFVDFIGQVRAFTVRFHDEIYNRYGIMRGDYSYVFAEIGDETVEIRPEPVEIETADIVFEPVRPSIDVSLQASGKGVAGLILYCLIVGIWGFIGFVKCDVR